MFGMIKRYLQGRARIIARAQMQNALKKVAKSIRDGKDSSKNSSKNSNDSAISNAIKGSVRKKSALSQIMAIIVSASLIIPHSNAMGVEVVSNPERIAQAYAQFVEQIEKYNTMIKNAMDTLDTMNRISDLTTQANSMINNLQTGLADPTQLYDRFQANLENIKNSAETLAENMKNKEWSEAFLKRDYASCQTKWQELLKNFKERKNEEERKQQTSETGQEKTETEQKQESTNKEGLNQEQQVINAQMNVLDKVYTEGVQGQQDINNKIHGFFNDIQNYMNYGNMENQIKGIQNPYAYQKRVCAMVEIEYLKKTRDDAKECYLENMINKNFKEAEKCLQAAKQADIDIMKKNNERSEAVYTKAHGQFNPSSQNTENVLDINEDTGDLLPSNKWKEEWSKAMGKTISDKMQVAENKSIPTTDEKGNKSSIKKWVAKLETIKILSSKGRTAEALALQNKRNMVIALQGDTQAIAQSQLETAQTLSLQIAELTKSVNELGNVQNEFLKQFLDDEDYNDDFTKDNNNLNNFSINEKRMMQFDESNSKFLVEYKNGLPALKSKKQDTSGITE